MNKRWIRIISVEVFVILLMILAGRDGRPDGKNQEEAVSSEEQNIEGETEETELTEKYEVHSTVTESTEKEESELETESSEERFSWEMSPEEFNQTGEQYSLLWVGDEYELTLYDKDNQKVDSERYPWSERHYGPEVYLGELSQDVLEITVSVGSPAAYVRYFDRETAAISPVYFNPILIENKYVGCLEDGILTVTDLFQTEGVYTEIERDFSGFLSVQNIELLDDSHIRVVYYSGEDFVTKTEEIELDFVGDENTHKN